MDLEQNLQKNKNFENRNNSFVIGIDHLSQSDDRKRFKNNFGLKGDVTLSQMENFDSTGLYLVNQTTFNSGFLLDMVLDMISTLLELIQITKLI